MMTMFMRSWILATTLILGFSLASQAQMYGTGMMGGMMACPYKQEIGDEAESVKDDILERQELLKELQTDLREEKTKLREHTRNLERARRDLERRGLESDYLEKVINHIEGGFPCSFYAGHPGYATPVATAPGATPVYQSPPPAAQPSQKNDDGGTYEPNPSEQKAPAKPKPKPPPKNKNKKSQKTSMEEIDDAESNSRMPAAAVDEVNSVEASAQGNATNDPAPFTTTQWHRNVCDPSGRGKVLSGTCTIDQAKVSKGFAMEACKSGLKSYQDSWAKKEKTENQITGLEARISGLKDDIAALKGDLKQAIRDHQRDLREQQTEGGCIDCMIAGNGGVSYQKPKTNWGGVIVNSVLALGAMGFGNSMQKQVAEQNARLGYQTSVYPTIGFGYPFIMGALNSAFGGGGLYGGIGGGMGAGGFGCANGVGGNGYGNMVGGAFGYPPGMFGTPYGGGMYTGFPMGGMPMGMAMGGGIGMMAGGMNGMMGGYPMGMMAGGMGGGMMGMPMGGYPMGMMAGGMGGGMMGMPTGGYPMGMMAGGMGGGMMGMPMGGYPMGMMAGGMGGGMMGMPMGSYPMGMMAGGMGGGMMGMGMDTSQMQMQMMQQQMQMQMQQQQMAMQMQARAQENAMNQYRVVMTLQQELQSVMYKLQQAQMGAYSGGYLNFGGGGQFNGGAYAPPGVPGGTYIPGSGGPVVPGTPQGPSSR